MIKRGILFLLFIGIFLVGSASAIDYYVAPNGNDGNSGTSYGSPHKTFWQALGSVQPGDTIYALGGTYGISNTYSMNDAGYTRIGFMGINSFPVTGSPASHGLPGSPITIRNYPGENPIFDGRNAGITGGIGIARDYWTIDGIEMMGQPINIESAHDIIIRNNHIHNLVADGGNNPGLIRLVQVNSPDQFNIYIFNNTLHDLSDIDSPGVWGEGAKDSAHHGAVAIITGAGHGGPIQDSPVNVQIMNNTIYNVPQAFFWKNTGLGPVIVQDNEIYNVGAFIAWHMMGQVRYIHNLFYNISMGPTSSGIGKNGMGCEINLNSKPIHLNSSGTDAWVINNTFHVGPEFTLFNVACAQRGIAKNNIIFGAGNNANSAYFIQRGDGEQGSPSYNHLDSASPLNSNLQTFTLDDNCIIGENPKSKYVKRHTWQGLYSETYTYDEQLPVFGYDPNSIFITEGNPDNFFIDAANGNLRLQNPSLCPNMGYYANQAPPAPTCEATGSGTCYYVDAVNGNDATGDGSYINPWQSFSSFGSISGNLNPKGIAAGDHIYLLDGTYSQSYASGDGDFGTCSLYLNGISGTQTDMIHLKAYPGTNPVINPSSSARGFCLKNADWWDIEGLEITGTYGIGIYLYPADNLLLHNLNVHDNDGISGNNIAGIHIKESQNVRIFDSVFRDNYDRTFSAPMDNSLNVVIFKGRDFYIYNNTFSQATDGACLKYKHAACSNPADCGNTLYSDSVFEVYNNTFTDCGRMGVGSMTANTHVHHNIFIRSGPAFRVENFAGPYNPINHHYEYNTIYDNTGAIDGLDAAQPIPLNRTFNNNIFYQTATSGPLVVDFTRYYTEPTYSQSLNELNFDNNCYYNPDAAVQFAVAQNRDGGTFNFAQWQALAGSNFDLNSLEEDPLFVDATNGDFHLLAGSNCTNAGVYAQLSAPTTCSLKHDSNTNGCNCMDSTEITLAVGGWFSGSTSISELVRHINVWKTTGTCS